MYTYAIFICAHVFACDCAACNMLTVSMQLSSTRTFVFSYKNKASDQTTLSAAACYLVCMYVTCCVCILDSVYAYYVV